MPHKKLETGLIVVKDTKFDKIRRKILIFLFGDDYEIVENYEKLIRVRKPSGDVIIPKSGK